MCNGCASALVRLKKMNSVEPLMAAGAARSESNSMPPMRRLRVHATRRRAVAAAAYMRTIVFSPVVDLALRVPHNGILNARRQQNNVVKGSTPYERFWAVPTTECLHGIAFGTQAGRAFLSPAQRVALGHALGKLEWALELWAACTGLL